MNTPTEVLVKESFEDTLVRDINNIVERFVLATPPVACLSDSTTPVELAYYRSRKYFSTEDSVDDDILDSAARDKWLSSDWERRPDMVIRSSAVRRVLYRARLLLQQWTADFYSHSLTNFDITSGETFQSAKGKTSVYQKLKDKKYWTVTADCVDMASKLVWSNRGLRVCASAFIRRATTKSYRKRLTKFMLSQQIKKSQLGFECFKVLLRLHVFTIVLGSRLETVPKDNTNRRTINVEPWFNVMCQRSLGLSLRKVSAKVGNDLEFGQEDHKRMISNRSYATIDFSAASDSMLPSVVKFMFSPKIVKDLESTRSIFTRYDKYDWHQPTLFSCMGNGYTFELMTLTLLAIARTIDSSSRVYGDDVIVRNRVAELFIECCSSIGFSVNTNKSFIYSKFRESCGAFYHDDHGYLTSFKLERCNDICDAIVLTNKLFILAKEYPEYSEVHKEVLLLWPSLHQATPPQNQTSLSGYVWNEKVCIGEDERALLNNVKTVLGTRLVDLQIETREIRVFLSFCKSPTLCSPFLLDIKKGNIAKTFYYIYSNRCTKDVLRNEYTISPVVMVQYHGSAVRLKTLMGEGNP